MKYQAYPEYKKTGIEWLGDIPQHWVVLRLKQAVKSGSSISYGIVQPGEPLEEGIPFVQTTNMSKGNFCLENLQKTTEEIARGYPRSKLDVGDVILGIRATIGAAYVVPEHLKGTNLSRGVARIVPGCKALSNFLVWYFRCFEVFTYWGLSKQGSTFSEVSIDTVKELGLLLPSIPEQEKIANFIGHETAKIDTLIEKQQQLIKLLKEKRQAVISHAVTKGLPSTTGADTPMKDSGVEWLGEVPEHWVVKRLKHTANLQSGIPKGKDLTGKISISVPMLRVANVQDGYLNLDDVHNMEIEPEQLQRYTLEKGDVLMNEGGDNDKLGRGAVWQCEIEPCIHQNHVFAIRPYSIEPEWLDLLTRASYAKFHFFRVAKQSTNLASISSTNIKETPLVIPPENERRGIMQYVHDKVDSFDKAEEKCAAQIELLKERRAALISAAVTGKIDVRNWQAPK